MSLGKARLKLIEDMTRLGYTQIDDAFDFQNVGNTRLEKAFHIEQGPIESQEFNQSTVTFSNSQTIRFWEKGKKKTNRLIDEALLSVDSALASIMSIENRVDEVVDIKIRSVDFERHSEDNDDIVRVVMVFDIEQVCAF